jgi:neutral ceramidase
MSTTLLAGVAGADITPPIGIAHANWGAQTHERAAGIDLPLTVTALALSDGEHVSLILDVDCCWLWDPLYQQTLAAVTALTGLPDESVRIAYTHTHSGPTAGTSHKWVGQGIEMWDPYHANLQQVAAGAAWSALESMQPVRVSAAEGISNISVNRRYQRPGDGAVVVGRNRDGVRDPAVQVLRFDSLDGEPVAAVVGFGCHPITVGPDNDLITPDYPGVVKQVVEDATGAVTLFLQGAAGDVGPVRGVAADGANQYKRLGTILGLEASRLWWESAPVTTTETYTGTLESGAPLAQYDDQPQDDVPAAVRVVQRVVELPARKAEDATALEAAVEEHIDNLARLRAEGGSDDDIRRETMSLKRAGMRARLHRRLEGRTTMPVEVYVTAIGDDIALLSVSIEMFAGTGLAIKAGSPFAHTLVSGYSGPSCGYLPTADAYPLGGYEVEITPFAPEASDVLVRECVRLLVELKGQS